MAKRKNAETEASTPTDTKVEIGDLASMLSEKPIYVYLPDIWIIGDTPLITHAWSHKAKQEMLGKQVKALKAGKEARDPDQDFVDSMYEMPVKDAKPDAPKVYGFPVTGVKNAILSAAHKDKGIAREHVMRSLWFDCEMVRVMPARAGAICDMPLVRIFGSEPEMREDMVKIGTGLTKTANLAYRAQFSRWAIRVRAKYNTSVIKPAVIAQLIEDGGLSSGIGEWRNEKKGVFGSFHFGRLPEIVAWNKFAAGKGPLPEPMVAQYAEAAD